MPPTGGYSPEAYDQATGAAYAGASNFYNAGATGQGVKIAIVDVGMVNPSNRTFAGKLDPATQDVAGYSPNDTFPHATYVASVAAGNSLPDHLGVAFGSTIIGLDVGGPPAGNAQTAAMPLAVARAIDIAVENGARVINLSIGFGGEYLPPEMPEIVAAARRAADAGVVIVVVASNEEGAPQPFATARALADQASNGNLIIAGGHDQLARNIYNHAGTYTQYLTALASGVGYIHTSGMYRQGGGTSGAAPIISGAVALVASAWPHLSGREIVEILLRSATDAGAPGFDPVWGNGILNLARAFQPQGRITVAGTGLQVSMDGNGAISAAMGDALNRSPVHATILDSYSRDYRMDLTRTLLAPSQERPLAQSIHGNFRTAGAGVGNTSLSMTINRHERLRPVTQSMRLGMSDDQVPLPEVVSGTIVSRIAPETAVGLGFSESGRSLQQRLSGDSPDAFLVARDPMSRSGFHAEAPSSLGIRHRLGPVGVTVTSEQGRVWEPGFPQPARESGYRIGAAALDRQIGPATVSIGAAHLDEDATVLGGRFNPLLSAAGARTFFLDAAASFNLGSGWGVSGSVRRGWTSLPGTGALVSEGRLATDAWAFDVSKAGLLNRGDRVAVRVMQPLRLRSGGFDMMVPTSYDHATRSAAFERRFLNLAPVGREVDVELAYALSFLGGSFALNAFHRSDPGHVEAGQDDLGAVIRLTLGF